jgi:hypothetical protein
MIIFGYTVKNLIRILWSEPLVRGRYRSGQCGGSGMFIPDPDFTHSGSFFCSHKFQKIVNYFIFEMQKKKIWANFSRFIELFTQKLSLSSQTYRFGIWDPESGKTHPGSGSATLDPGLRIRTKMSGFLTLIPVFPLSFVLLVTYSGSRYQNVTGSQIRIRNSVSGSGMLISIPRDAE